MVEKGSIKREDNGLTVHFNITDYQETVKVTYTGLLPDLFSEDEGAVVAGILRRDGRILADEVLAKHDENYMSAEISSTLKEHPEKVEM